VAVEIGGSARSLGMGGAGIADLSEAGAIWANPARLAGLASPEMSFMHGLYLGGMTLEQLAVGGPTGWGVFGGGVTLLRMGDLDSYDATGASVGSFSPGDQAVSAGWAWPGKAWAAGAAVTYHHSQLAADAKASAWTGDAGGSVTPVPALTIAAAVQHLGSGLDYGGKSASLPFVVRGGAAYALKEFGIVVAADGVKPSDGTLSIRAGAEKSIALRSDVTAAVRAGWRTGAPQGSLAGIAAGAEMFWHPASGFSEAGSAREEGSYPVTGIRIAYAWTPLGELGTAHWFLIGLTF
jgi:hypothetical protein